MSHRSKIIKEWIDLTVTNPNSVVKDSFEIDKLAARILGISITSNLDDQLYFRGSQRIAINDKEIYPEGYESKMLMQGLNVPVNHRIIRLGEIIEPGNRKVDIEYKDTDHPALGFTAYTVRLYVYSIIAD